MNRLRDIGERSNQEQSFIYQCDKIYKQPTNIHILMKLTILSLFAQSIERIRQEKDRQWRAGRRERRTGHS